MCQHPETGAGAPQRLGRRGQRRIPFELAPAAVGLLDRRGLQAIGAVDALVAEAIAVGDPGLVDFLARARHHAHELPAQHVTVELRAHAIVRRDQRILRHLPAAAAIAEGLAVERADRAQINDIAGELVIDAALDVGANLHVLAAAGSTHLLDTGDVLSEADTARAVNTARHVGGHERTEILVLDDALALHEARYVATIADRQILQLALPALVADRAVERVVDQQELHGRALRADRLDRSGEHLHALGHRRRTGGQRLGRLLHFDQAHAAIGRDRQLVVVAEARDVDAFAIGRADDDLTLARLDRDTIDLYVDQFLAHGHLRQPAPACRRCCVRRAGPCIRTRDESASGSSARARRPHRRARRWYGLRCDWPRRAAGSHPPCAPCRRGCD